MGGHLPDGGAHPGVFGNHHVGEWRRKDGRLVHVLHRHLDVRGVAERAQAEEVGVNVSVGGLDPQREDALCFEVQRLEETQGHKWSRSANDHEQSNFCPTPAAFSLLLILLPPASIHSRSKALTCHIQEDEAVPPALRG